MFSSFKRCFRDASACWAAAISAVVRGDILSSSLRFANTSFMWKQWACVGMLASLVLRQWCAKDFHLCTLNYSGSTPSIAWVYSLVVLSLRSYSSCEIASTTVLWIPFIYIISGAYSTKSNRQRYTLSEVSSTQRPKRRDFERDSYKMALKIAPANFFLLNVQPELRRAIGEKSCTNSTICTQSIYRTKERFFPFVR